MNILIKNWCPKLATFGLLKKHECSIVPYFPHCAFIAQTGDRRCIGKTWIHPTAFLNTGIGPYVPAIPSDVLWIGITSHRLGDLISNPSESRTSFIIFLLSQLNSRVSYVFENNANHHVQEKKLMIKEPKIEFFNSKSHAPNFGCRRISLINSEPFFDVTVSFKTDEQTWGEALRRASIKVLNNQTWELTWQCVLLLSPSGQ